MLQLHRSSTPSLGSCMNPGARTPPQSLLLDLSSFPCPVFVMQITGFYSHESFEYVHQDLIFTSNVNRWSVESYSLSLNMMN